MTGPFEFPFRPTFLQLYVADTVYLSGVTQVSQEDSVLSLEMGNGKGNLRSLLKIILTTGKRTRTTANTPVLKHIKGNRK